MIAAEWLKLRSLRSTWVLLGLAVATVLLGMGLAFQAVGIWDGLTGERRDRMTLSPISGLTCWLSGLCLAILGSQTISGEFSSGMIRNSLTVVPRRLPILAGKAVLVGGVALVLGQAVSFASFAVTRWVIGDRPMRLNTTSLADETQWLVACGLLVPVSALLGLGLGTLTRRTAATIGLFVLPWYVLPIAGNLLSAPWLQRLALTSLADDLGGRGVLPPLVALALLAGYATIPLAAGAVLLRRRDVG